MPQDDLKRIDDDHSAGGRPKGIKAVDRLSLTIVIIFVAYPISIGPVAMLFKHIGLALESEWFIYSYYPVLFISEKCGVGELLYWYLKLWGAR